MKFILPNIILSLFFLSNVFADEPSTLEKIVVRPQDSVQTLSAVQIKEKELNSLVDALDYVSGLDLRYRGNFGIQGDLSLRGSTYEQVAVLIDGLNLIDPQTGHHNLDIPLTIFDVEKIEVRKEGVSSLYGPGAFAGSINIVTKKPSKKVLNLDTVFGEHALFSQALSFSLPQENLSSRLSFDHKIAKAARANTDFKYKTVSLCLNRDFEDATLDTLFGYQKKDFGADSFYSNLFPEEEEHTETFFLKTGLSANLDFASTRNNLFFRKHRDKFILRRNNPTSVNYHTTYVYGLNSKLSLPMKYGDILLGIDTGRDEIYSTNLGKHTRLHEAGSFGFIPKLENRLSADFRLRFDHYQKWNEEVSYNFALGSNVIDEKLKIRGSLSRAFRIPSFTELYYSDAANKGNAGLGIEKSDNVIVGLQFIQDFLNLGLEGFYRKGRNLIDWTRASSSERWQATNLGRVDFYGIELSAKLDKINFSYNYTAASQKAGGFFSKYALDILKHQFILEVYPEIFGCNLSWQLSYEQRYYGETYFVGNIYIGKRFTQRNFTLEPFVKIDNFTDTKYTEVANVPQPGRWIKSGLKFTW